MWRGTATYSAKAPCRRYSPGETPALSGCRKDSPHRDDRNSTSHNKLWSQTLTDRQPGTLSPRPRFCRQHRKLHDPLSAGNTASGAAVKSVDVTSTDPACPHLDQQVLGTYLRFRHFSHFVSGAEDGSIMAGPEGARPPSLDGGEPGDHAGPLISEFSFEVK